MPMFETVDGQCCIALQDYRRDHDPSDWQPFSTAALHRVKMALLARHHGLTG